MSTPYISMVAGTAPAPAEASDLLGALDGRVRGEFLEMPGLRLTAPQAARLWALDHATSMHLLESLTATGFLSRTGDGRYLRRS